MLAQISAATARPVSLLMGTSYWIRMERQDIQCLRSYAIDGNAAAFAQVVDRHAGWITAAAQRRLRDRHLGEDAAQAVFMLLASKAPHIVNSQQSSIGAWLFHAMNLTCSRLQRSQTRRQRLESRSQRTVRGELPSDDLRGMLEDAIAQLPPLDRQAIVRRFYQGMDYQTIASELECTAEAVRKRIARALVSARAWMLQDGVDVIPDELLAGIPTSGEPPAGMSQRARDDVRIGELAKGTMTMMQQTEATDFTVWSAEFFVKDVESNLDFFEKLGFRRHFVDSPDAMGRIPRASLRGGKTARIWLRRASESEGTRPTPGMTLYFWIEGGGSALTAHRDAIAGQGVNPSPFFDDLTLRNFTVTSPDGYTVGFFTSYR
jgi:RNA polymerase sigma factor (sigma-70 family)